MRIALDLSPLGPQLPLGVARVVRASLEALRERADVALLELTPPRSASRGLARGAWRQRALPALARAGRADVLHTFVSAFPLISRVPVVATVHELPWRHGERENAGLAHRAYARLAPARCAAVVAPSGAVARDLGGGPRVHVVPWGVAPAFRAAAADGDAALRARLGLRARPYVLAVGGARAKKRLPLLLAARAAARDGFDIVVTGAREAPGAIAAGTLSDEELAGLYRGALATAVLARSEGFGLPVLESLACGTPVVAPRGSVQAATAGGLAEEVEIAPAPEVAAFALAGALESLADSPPDAARRAAFASHAAEFTWTRTAARLVEVWGEARRDA